MGLIVGSIDDACASFRAWLDNDTFIQQTTLDKNRIFKEVSSKIDGGYFGRVGLKQSLFQFLPMHLACRVTRAVQRIFEHRTISQFFHAISPQGEFGKSLPEHTRKSIQTCYAQLCTGDKRLDDFFQELNRVPEIRDRIESKIKNIFSRTHINADQEQGLLISVFADTQVKSREGYKVKEERFYPDKISQERRAEEKVTLHPVCSPLQPPNQQLTTIFECFAQDPLDAAIDLRLRGLEPCVITAVDPTLHKGHVEEGGSGAEEDLYRRSNAAMIVDSAHNQSLKQKFDDYSKTIGRADLLSLSGIHAESICVFKKGREEDYKCMPPVFIPCIFASPKTMDSSLAFQPVLQGIDFHLTREKIRGVLRIAALHGHQDLILPAFGCEGEGQDPALVARFFGEIFNEVEFKNRFRVVRFALPAFQGTKTHYEAFLKDSGLRRLAGVSPQEKRDRNSSIEPPISYKRNKQTERSTSDPNALPVPTVIHVKDEPIFQHEGPVTVFKTSAPSVAMNVEKVAARHVSSLQSRRQKQKQAGIPIDLNREKLDMPATVISIRHDSHYHRFIAFLRYKDGEERHIFAPQGLKEGDEVISSDTEPRLTIGSTTRLKNIPIGSSVHCIEEIPGGGARFATASGMAGKLLSKEGHGVWLQMPSGRPFLLNGLCRATIGMVRL